MGDHVHVEEEWRPPTEAEMDQIRRRRERSDRISQIMSQYMLRGYKMLANVCQNCDVCKSVLNLRFSMLDFVFLRLLCWKIELVDSFVSHARKWTGSNKQTLLIPVNFLVDLQKLRTFFQILHALKRILSKINQLSRRRSRFLSFI